jgi:hypothetical protein
MSAVLVEQRVERGTGDPYCRRVTAEGEVLEQSSTSARFDGTEWHFDAQPLEWRPVTRLDESELEAIRAAIADSGFMSLASEHRPPGTSIGGSDVTWSATLDGRANTVTLYGVPDVQVPEVDALATAVETAIGQALTRASA